MPNAPEKLNTFNALLEVVKHLRGPEGCPWDKEQTHRTLTPYAIEEAHELAEAIEKGTKQDVIEELGDVLLQVIIHAEIARQEESFDIYDVIQAINQKMVRRHPHVFSDIQLKTSEQVIENWQQIKAQEENKEQNKGFFNIPVHLPALMRSQKMGQKTMKYRFDWTEPQQVMAKIDEELQELKEALTQKDLSEQQKELGDLLFTIAQLARHLNFDAEQALRETNDRFEYRFTKMRELIDRENKDFNSLNPDELEAYWQLAKL